METRNNVQTQFFLFIFFLHSILSYKMGSPRFPLHLLIFTILSYSQYQLVYNICTGELPVKTHADKQ